MRYACPYHGTALDIDKCGVCEYVLIEWTKVHRPDLVKERNDADT